MSKDSNDVSKLLDELYSKYGNSDFMKSKLDLFIKNLPKQMETSYTNHLSSRERSEAMEKLISDCINDFFSKHVFFYYQNTNDLYYHYSNDIFTVYNESEFTAFVYEFINKTGDPKLMYKYKYKIEKIIVKKVKKQVLLNAIPTSKTIQSVIDMFYPLHIKSRNLVKMFLCNMGNNIKRKTTNHNFLVSTCAKTFLNVINDDVHMIIGNLDCFQNVKYKYTGQENVLFLNANLHTMDFLKFNKYIHSIIVVACHYADRFKVQTIISKCDQKTRDILNTFENIDNIIQKFLRQYCIIDNTNTNHGINRKDMYFLWKIYTEEENFPVILSEKKVISHISQYLISENEVFIHAQSIVNDEIKELLKFIKNSFIPSVDDNEYEIDEIINMYMLIKKVDSFNTSNDIVIKALQYYMRDIHMIHNKILGLTCSYWNKTKEIKDFIMSYMIQKENIQSPYHTYSSYIQSNAVFKANKAEFESIYNDIT